MCDGTYGNRPVSMFLNWRHLANSEHHLIGKQMENEATPA
jgi:hypothetical protein